MKITKLAGLALAVALLSTACFDSSDPETSAIPTEDDTLAFIEADTSESTEPDDPADLDSVDPADAGDPVAADAETSETDRPCNGGAFPDDAEFRELLCAVQWAQVDLLAAGGEFDASWTGRSPAAILLYSDDRDAAIAELELILAEMEAATPGQTAPDTNADATDAIEVGQQYEGLQACMVEVAQLIIVANVSANFDPTNIQAWQIDVDAIEVMVDNGDLVDAELAVCALRDEIAAAIEDPSLVP